MNNEQQEEQQSTSSLFLECRGLRYALPYEAVSKPTFLKLPPGDTKTPLATALGRLYRRQRGTQDVQQAVAYWQAEIDAARVEWRYAKKTRNDPWQWYDVNIIGNDRNNGNDADRDSNNRTTTVMVQPGMSVRFRQHVHEKVVPAVGAGNVPILYSDDHFLAIHKPAGLAVVDETGGRGVNALLTMVAAQLGLGAKKITPAHRLDKSVSGVLLLGKSPSQAAKLLQTIQTDPLVRKRYIARCSRRRRREDEEVEAVVGATLSPVPNDTTTPAIQMNDNFPTDHFTVTLDLAWDSRHRRSVPCTSAQSAQRAVDRQAHATGQAAKRAKKRRKQEQMVPKGGGNDGATGAVCDDKNDDEDDDNNVKTPTKPTLHTTIFRRLGPPLSDGTILVECQPITGYRHQIRAHLAAVGWPIVHDTVYGGVAITDDDDDNNTALQAFVDDEAGTLHSALTDPAIWRPWCNKCQWTCRVLSSQQQSGQENSDGNDDKPILVEANGIWLHSHCYVLPSKNLNVVAPLPGWAKDASAFL